MIRKKSNQLLIILTVVLVCAFAGFFYLNSVFKVQPVSGQKQVTVVVIHGDGKSTSHTYQTNSEYLGELLITEDLAEGDEDAYGLFIHTVEGEKADEQKQQWWCITKDGQDVMTGADTTVIQDKEKYELTLKTGYGQ